MSQQPPTEQEFRGILLLKQWATYLAIAIPALFLENDKHLNVTWLVITALVAWKFAGLMVHHRYPSQTPPESR